MNSKILSAFLGGALLASGTVYLLVRPKADLSDAVVQAAPSAPAPPQIQTAPTPPAAVDQVKPPVEDVPAEEVKPSPAPKQREIRRYTPLPDPVEPVKPAVVLTPPPTLADAGQPEPMASPVPIAEANPIPSPKPLSVVIRPGTLIQVRLGETLTTRVSHAGDKFLATLAAPLVVNGWVIAERGARAFGTVVESDKAGRVKGVAQLGVQLTRITTSDGQRIPVNTLTFSETGRTSRREDGMKVGALAGIGAAIGAIAGGGAGAGIGALAGGAAGTGDVMATRGKDAVLPSETRISFRVQQPVTITERMN